MKRIFIVTEKAGRDVAGVPSPGADMPLHLTKSQAEHHLRLGYLRLPTDHDGDGRMGGSKPGRKAK